MKGVGAEGDYFCVWVGEGAVQARQAQRLNRKVLDNLGKFVRLENNKGDSWREFKIHLIGRQSVGDAGHRPWE